MATASATVFIPVQDVDREKISVLDTELFFFEVGDYDSSWQTFITFINNVQKGGTPLDAKEKNQLIREIRANVAEQLDGLGGKIDTRHGYTFGYGRIYVTAAMKETLQGSDQILAKATVEILKNSYRAFYTQALLVAPKLARAKNYTC